MMRALTLTLTPLLASIDRRSCIMYQKTSLESPKGHLQPFQHTFKPFEAPKFSSSTTEDL